MIPSEMSKTSANKRNIFIWHDKDIARVLFIFTMVVDHMPKGSITFPMFSVLSKLLVSNLITCVQQIHA
jgi:hypothetical protein